MNSCEMKGQIGEITFLGGIILVEPLTAGGEGTGGDLTPPRRRAGGPAVRFPTV